MKDLCDSKEVPELMQAHFDAGEYGVKSEKGFYDYSDGRAKEATKERDEKFLRVYQALYGSKQNHRIKKSADWNGEFPVLFCDSQH